MKKYLFIVLFCVMPGVGLSGQVQIDTKEFADNGRIFSQIADSASRVKTLSSDFIQEKHLSMLENVLIAKGRFYYKRNDRLRWELNEPIISGFSVNGRKAKRWDGKSGKTQLFEVREVPFIEVFADQVFAWTKADFKGLQKRYRIEVLAQTPADLKLFPIFSQEKKYLDHLRIVFAADAGYVNAVEVHEPDGDFTRIRFLNTRINEPLQDSLFN